MQQNLPPAQARALIFEQLKPLSSARLTEAVPLQQALGRILARDAAAPLDLPPFDNSAMDGYALRCGDIGGARTDAPLALRCEHTIAAAPASALDQASVEAGRCVRIMTGAPLPAGADAIVMREDVDESDAARILFFGPARVGQSIRRRGEDIERGELAVSGGTRLRAAEVALLAACGLPSVEVSCRPRVAIIVTGDELVEPGQPLAAGQIYNSNAFALAALCQECGAQVVRQERAGDDARQLARLLLDCARECDVVLTSGGVSAGDFDPVRDVLLGTEALPRIARPHFWKAAIKPGKPILFATMPRFGSGEGAGDEEPGRVPIFALPGNPVSVAVTFELFVRPALLWMQGARDGERRAVRAEVDCAGHSPQGKTEYVRALVTNTLASNTLASNTLASNTLASNTGVSKGAGSGSGSNRWRAQVSGAQGSGRLSTLARANALLVIPPQTTRYEAGDEFEARLLE